MISHEELSPTSKKPANRPQIHTMSHGITQQLIATTDSIF